MRTIVLASALLAALAISATAHATPVTTATTYFYFHDDGLSIAFNLNPPEIADITTGESVVYYLVFSDESVLELNFTNPTWCLANIGESFDFFISDNVSFLFGYTGPQLYTGDESAPIFTSGTYDLTSAPGFGFTGNPDARLIISASPIVPEPSSLLLLGTGVLGCLVAVRRRFVKA